VRHHRGGDGSRKALYQDPGGELQRGAAVQHLAAAAGDQSVTPHHQEAERAEEVESQAGQPGGGAAVCQRDGGCRPRRRPPNHPQFHQRPANDGSRKALIY